MIIGSCGESERPARLYRFYASLLRPFGLLPQTPLGIGIFGRIISFVLLGIFLSLSFVTFYRPVFWAASLLLLFVGGWHAQAPSLSNDLPMFLWGFFLAGTLVSVVLGPFSRLGVLWRATLPLLLLVPLSFIERSWLAGVPSLLALVLVSITALVPPIRKQNTPRWIPALTILVGLTAVLAFAVRWVLPYLLAHYAAPFSRLSELNPDIAFLANVGKINLHEFYLFSLWHLKSWAGTFVWGHTELPWLVRTSWIVVWSSLCALGVLTLFREFRSATTRTLPILILLTLAAPLLISHFLVVEASGSYMFHQDLGIAQSFAKARLTAPGGAALSLLPLCALSAFLKRPPLRLQTCSYAALAAFSWALAYWLPSTYLIAVL
jgi:hypothetical protein